MLKLLHIKGSVYIEDCCCNSTLSPGAPTVIYKSGTEASVNEALWQHYANSQSSQITEKPLVTHTSHSRLCFPTPGPLSALVLLLAQTATISYPTADTSPCFVIVFFCCSSLFTTSQTHKAKELTDFYLNYMFKLTPLHHAQRSLSVTVCGRLGKITLYFRDYLELEV